MSTSIPQAIYDHYNAVYNNQTYRAFQTCLEAHSQENTSFSDLILHFLTDAALERAGAGIMAGSEQQLMRLIAPISDDLVKAAQAHLVQFGPDPDLPVEPPAITEQLQLARQKSLDAAQAASEIAGWRGRVAFKLASAATYLLHAAEAMLIETHFANYPLEKLDHAMDNLRDAVEDARQNNFAINPDFVAWLLARIRARY
jgi:hypothetical protein